MSEDLRAVRGAWQGGPCPSCGDVMPANVVHCMSCRAMLNSELRDDSVEIPQFIPLPEVNELKIAKPRGHYVRCEGCQEELRINSKYTMAKVQCRHCDHTFEYNSGVEQVAMYCNCPHCDQEIRASTRYIGQNVACRFCDSPLRLEESP